MSLNRAKVIEIQNEFSEAVKALAEKHGLKLSKGTSARYSETGVKLSVEFVTVTEAGNDARAEEDFKRYAKLDGLEPTDLGRSFSCAGTRFTITGYRSRARKRPILARNEATGRTHIFDAPSVRSFLAFESMREKAAAATK